LSVIEEASPLKLHHGLAKLTTWNEQTSRDRAERLANMAADVWAILKLDASILEAYRLQPTTPPPA